HNGASFGPAVNRHEPALRWGVERGVARIGQMTNIVEQVIPDTTHGVHTRTPRYPAVAQATRKSSSLTRRSGPSAGPWKITSLCARPNGTTKCHWNIAP